MNPFRSDGNPGGNSESGIRLKFLFLMWKLSYFFILQAIQPNPRLKMAVFRPKIHVGCHHRLFIFIVWSVLISPDTVWSQDSFSGSGFIPDKKVEIIAQEADRNYFPLFINSLQWIKSSKYEVINAYFISEEKPVTDNNAPVVYADPSQFKDPLVFHIGPYFPVTNEITFPIDWSDTTNPELSFQLWYQSLTWLYPYLNSNNEDSLNAAYCVITIGLSIIRCILQNTKCLHSGIMLLPNVCKY
jgi:hypothetical protein